MVLPKDHRNLSTSLVRRGRPPLGPSSPPYLSLTFMLTIAVIAQVTHRPRFCGEMEKCIQYKVSTILSSPHRAKRKHWQKCRGPRKFYSTEQTCPDL